MQIQPYQYSHLAGTITMDGNITIKNITTN